ncbi:MAG: IS5 family transposase [Candidatus Vecturithrix sp.]|nr:IS5 family transposase [Candidatus Vecturithrix sp.]
MQAKDTSFKESHVELFRSSLEQILDRRHPLYFLADKIDWKIFDCSFGSLFSQKKGRPALPTRLVVGLHYLKYTYNESDESAVARLLENPYWQYCCGFKHFQHELPIDPSSMTRWRKRLGADKIEELLIMTIHTAKEEKLLTEKHVERVNVDTTVQEKAIAFPTNARLYHKARRVLIRLAKRMHIDLRQSYERTGKKVFLKQVRYASAGQYNRAKKETKKLKTILGRVIHDIERKCSAPGGRLLRVLNIAKAIFTQKRADKNKVYSVHAPEVECIAKGKVHKKYAFGCKVSMVSSSKDNWILAIDALHGNPFDGHTLKDALHQVKQNTDWQPLHAYCDRGYRGVARDIPDTEVHLSGKKKKSTKASFGKWFARRSAIEPIFGHLKSDHRLDRNHLQGEDGDRMNVILSGCGFNLRKLRRAFFLPFSQWLFWRYFDHSTGFIGSIMTEDPLNTIPVHAI